MRAPFETHVPADGACEITRPVPSTRGFNDAANKLAIASLPGLPPRSGTRTSPRATASVKAGMGAGAAAEFAAGAGVGEMAAGAWAIAGREGTTPRYGRAARAISLNAGAATTPP